MEGGAVVIEATLEACAGYFPSTSDAQPMPAIIPRPQRSAGRRIDTMHLKRDDSHHHGPPVIPITFHLEDPEGLTGTPQKVWEVLGGEHESILEVAMDNGINIEHACGGVCACSTCHIYLEQGAQQVSEASEDEEDRVEEAPGIRRTSRLACQCELKDLGEGKRVPIVVRVPSWNRNAVKEIPH